MEIEVSLNTGTPPRGQGASRQHTAGTLHPDILSAFRELRRARPDAAAVEYFGNSISRAELDELSDALAVGLAERGVTAGERVAVSLQNTPVFAAAILAAWKVGAIFVPVSPLLKIGELTALLTDSGARVLVAHPDMAPVIEPALAHLDDPPHPLWSSPADLSGGLEGPWSATETVLPSTGAAVLDVIDAHRGLRPPTRGAVPGDIAVIAYTSGTTGPSKGAMLTHANVAYHPRVVPGWLGLTVADSILTIAPFFHITGLGMHLLLGLGGGFPLVMTYRFEPRQVLALIEAYAPTFTVGTITAFIALEKEAADEMSRRALGRVSRVVSGGAAVPAGVIERYEREVGVYIQNGFGMTESASATILVPLGERAPIDPASGAVSIGRALPGVDVSIVDEDGEPVPTGTAGELVISGPQVGAGYWNRPEDTAHTFRADGLHTGDVGVIDDQGWVYIVDRIKDLIVVSGYKVWPRDVEDALYRHPAIVEAAVIGVPDEYRGESVKAFVVLREGAEVTPDELNAHCRVHLSAYKCPREYDIVSTLPKSATGKILRRMLRPPSGAKQ